MNTKEVDNAIELMESIIKKIKEYNKNENWVDEDYEEELEFDRQSALIIAKSLQVKYRTDIEE